MAHERILIIDGDIELSELLKMRLKSVGYLVECAHRGNHALDILESQWIDLIILAVVLQGGMNGFQIFREIKSREEFFKIPIMVHSSKAAMKKIFKKMGAECFFIKPYSIDIFLNKINLILKKSIVPGKKKKTKKR